MAVTTLVFDTLTPVAAYAALRQAEPLGASFLFESVVGGERWGRRTVVGYRPRLDATLTLDGWTVRGPQGERHVGARGQDPLVAAREVFGFDAGKGSPPLASGGPVVGSAPIEELAHAHFGYFAWDLVQTLSKVPAHDRLPGPLARFVGDCTLVVFDNLEQTVSVIGPTPEDVSRALSDLARAPSLASFPRPDRARIPVDILLGMSDEKYIGVVRRAKEYIAAGDAFQIVLGRSFYVPARGRDPFAVYRALRVVNPSPYMYFLDLPAPFEQKGKEEGRTQILGASPETCVRLERGIMTVRPIAGTRPRGKTEAEDILLERELTTDIKELAEHVMLIDLGRNDVGRVAVTGSVELVRRMQVERYSHVMHLVSEVRGTVPPGTPPLEVLRAAFPAGTLSGAPKVRAMQIIHELEGRPRGIYGGAIGYLAPSGDLDFAIAIRTAVCQGDRFEITAGAGIVEGSVPENEAAETWSKAKGVLCAVEVAG
jgi:anthranilate synthase component 1